MDLSYRPAQQHDFDGSARARLSIHTVFLLYRQRFRRWFAITAPTSLVASFVWRIADDRIRAIYRSIPVSEIRYHPAEVAEGYLLRFGSFLISWFLGCFALAAIAAMVNGSDADDDESVWKSDSHQRAREHFGQIFTYCPVHLWCFSCRNGGGRVCYLRHCTSRRPCALRPIQFSHWYCRFRRDCKRHKLVWNGDSANPARKHRSMASSSAKHKDKQWLRRLSFSLGSRIRLGFLCRMVRSSLWPCTCANVSQIHHLVLSLKSESCPFWNCEFERMASARYLSPRSGDSGY